MDAKYVIALLVLVVGIFLMSIVGYTGGIILIPFLIIAAGYYKSSERGD